MNNVKYRLHPVYNLFGADKKGNLISVITKRPPISNSSGSRIKIRGQTPRHFMFDKLVFIWECNNGVIPKDKTVLHASDTDSDDEIDNLQLVDVNKRHEIVAARWKNKFWECPGCGFQTTNNARRHHKKVCRYSNDPYSDEENARTNRNRINWKNKEFDCQFCGKSYRNYYKYVHTALCERKHREMED